MVDGTADHAVGLVDWCTSGQVDWWTCGLVDWWTGGLVDLLTEMVEWTEMAGGLME